MKLISKPADDWTDKIKITSYLVRTIVGLVFMMQFINCLIINKKQNSDQGCTVLESINHPITVT